MKFLKNQKILDIAEGNPEDAEQILEYLNHIGKESSFLILDEKGVNKSVEQEKEYLQNNLESIINKTFVGKVDNKIVSVCGIHGIDKPKVAHNVSVGMSVLKEFWNTGVGTHMMNYLVNYCRTTDTIKNITLEVREDNEHAIRLYENVGFKKCGNYSDKFKLDGKYFDCIIMEMQI